jgi:hypothetical protein
MYKPELTYSVWVDYIHHKRSIKSLEEDLKKGIKNGDYLGYRLIIVHKELIGVKK